MLLSIILAINDILWQVVMSWQSLASIVVEWVAVLFFWELWNSVHDLKMDSVVFMILSCAHVNDPSYAYARLPLRHAMAYFCHHLLCCLRGYSLVEILLQATSKLWIEYSLSRRPSEYVLQRVLDCFDIHKLWHSPLVWLHPLLVESTSSIIACLEHNCNCWKLLWSCILAFSCKDTQVL